VKLKNESGKTPGAMQWNSAMGGILYKFIPTYLERQIDLLISLDLPPQKSFSSFHPPLE
jgi:hypothetical protein